MFKKKMEENKDIRSNSAILEELKQKLPQYFSKDIFDDTGEKIESGNFDIEKLRLDILESDSQEFTNGFNLNFIGKDYAKKQAGETSSNIIVPNTKHNNIDDNVDSQNLLFSGDNLEVLRHLQNNYQRSIDFIYIDPPYNTGTDGFVYPDKFEYTDEKLKEIFNLEENELIRMKSILDKSSHSAWLTFMYPRLWLAKRLLTDEGIIFISIDSNEDANLKLLCNEIFGEASFVGNIGWESKTKAQNTTSSYDKLQPKIEYILVYSNVRTNHFNLIEVGNKDYPFNDDRGPYREYQLEKMNAEDIRGRNTMIFDIDGVSPPKGMQWKLGKDKIQSYKDKNRLEIRDGKVIVKIGPEDEKTVETKPFWSFFNKNEFGTAESAKKSLEKLMDEKGLFDTVKPVSLVQRLIFHATNKNSTVLDFFAGSGTTGEAVYRQNCKDGGSRKFILVQLPEKTYNLENNEKVAKKNTLSAYNAGFNSIDEITLERLNIVKKNLKADYTEIDLGFKHYFVTEPKAQTIKDIESYNPDSGLFENENGQLVDLSFSNFDNMVEPFSAFALDLPGDAEGKETILTTWMAEDGYTFDTKSTEFHIDDYRSDYIENSRLYFINNGWTSNHTKYLINLLGNNEIKVQSIVVYTYSFDFESIREIEIGLKQLNYNINLVKKY